MPRKLMHVRIEVSDKVYLKDPMSSALGKDILVKGMKMIDVLGMEGFTFRKLAVEVGTTESAVYRYFENKHRLLLYYVEWYWAWLEYEVAFATANLQSPKLQLERAIEIVTKNAIATCEQPFDMSILQRLVVAESSKSYLTKIVDEENREGLFSHYKAICRRMGGLIGACAPDYPNAHSLASLFIESHLDQIYFAAHLPSLSEVGSNEKLRFDFFKVIIFNTLAQWLIKSSTIPEDQ
jgi:AcrR family transcriptional regulator